MADLVIFDLDNTLVDRNAIFLRWLDDFIREQRLDPAVARPWFIGQDDDGMTKRTLLFERARREFGLAADEDRLVADFWAHQVAHFRCELSTLDALRELRAKGHRIGIATNGKPVQEEKIRSAGLDREVDGWCVSGLVGHAKPDPRIFEILAERCGSTLEGAWVVGDRAEFDIAGAVAVGARSIWMRRGATWPTADFRPTHVVDAISDIPAIILGAGLPVDAQKLVHRTFQTDAAPD